MCSNLARESEISDNNSKNLDESWTCPSFLKLNGWDENCQIFKVHYPIFTFPFNWMHLNG